MRSLKELTEDLEERQGQLGRLPQRIFEAHENIGGKDRITELKLQCKMKLNELAGDAAMEVGDDKKRLYTNKEQREARALVLAQNDPRYYPAWMDEIQRIENDRRDAERDYDALLNEFSAIKAIVKSLNTLIPVAASEQSRIEIAIGKQQKLAQGEKIRKVISDATAVLEDLEVQNV